LFRNTARVVVVFIVGAAAGFLVVAAVSHLVEFWLHQINFATQQTLP